MFYYRRSIENQRNAFYSIDLTSGQETELIRGAGGLNLSPDGRYIATVSGAAGILIPTGGGSSKELLRADESQGINVAFWAPDSMSVYFRKGAAGGQAELWRAPVSGAAPQKTGITFPFTGPMLRSRMAAASLRRRCPACAKKSGWWRTFPAAEK
jgi:hypothetical protein